VPESKELKCSVSQTDIESVNYCNYIGFITELSGVNARSHVTHDVDI